jgi:hypothetical protein
MKQIIIALTLLIANTTLAQEIKPELESKVESKIVYGIGGSLVVNGHYTSDDLTISSTSGSYSANYDVTNGFSLDLSAMKSEQNSWGFLGVLSLGQERKIDGGAVAGVAVSMPNTKFRTHSISANTVYRWDKFYLPFGLNYSTTSISGDATITSVSGGLGYQLGAGYFIDENLAVDYTAIHSLVKINGKSGNTLYNYGNGYLTEVHIGLKYYFK